MNRAALTWLLASLLSISFIAPAEAAVHSSQPATAALPVAQDPAPRAWKRYRYEVDGFSAEFPGEPKTTPNDGNTGTRYFTSLENDNLAYFVERAELPADLDKTPEQIFDGYAGGAANGTKSEIKSQKPISLRSYPGREFILESDTLIMTFRLYLQGKTLYQVLVVATKELAPGAETKRFLDSFEILK